MSQCRGRGGSGESSGAGPRPGWAAGPGRGAVRSRAEPVGLSWGGLGPDRRAAGRGRQLRQAGVGAA